MYLKPAIAYDLPVSFYTLFILLYTGNGDDICWQW